MLVGHFMHSHVKWSCDFDLMYRFLIIVALRQEIKTPTALTAPNEREQFRLQSFRLSHMKAARLDADKLHTDRVDEFLL